MSSFLGLEAHFRPVKDKNQRPGVENVGGSSTFFKNTRRRDGPAASSAGADGTASGSDKNVELRLDATFEYFAAFFFDYRRDQSRAREDASSSLENTWGRSGGGGHGPPPMCNILPPRADNVSLVPFLADQGFPNMRTRYNAERSLLFVTLMGYFLSTEQRHYGTGRGRGFGGAGGAEHFAGADRGQEDQHLRVQ